MRLLLAVLALFMFSLACRAMGGLWGLPAPVIHWRGTLLTEGVPLYTSRGEAALILVGAFIGMVACLYGAIRRRGADSNHPQER